MALRGTLPPTRLVLQHLVYITCTGSLLAVFVSLKGTYLLTTGLVPALEKSEAARVVSV